MDHSYTRSRFFSKMGYSTKKVPAMARVTVEDCLKNVKNRFELVIIAAKRARQLMRGKEPKVAWDNDKCTVVALREIAAGFKETDTRDSQEANFVAPSFTAPTPKTESL